LWARIDEGRPANDKDFLGNTHTSAAVILWHNHNGGIESYYFTDGQYGNMVTDPVFSAGPQGWHFIVWTVHATDASHIEQRLYMDNVLLKAQTFQQTMSAFVNFDILLIGQTGVPVNTDAPFPDEYFYGAIENVEIFNRVLSAEEVASLWNYGNGTYSLDCCYHLYRGQDGIIDHVTPVALMGVDDNHVKMSNQVLPPDTIWYYVRRRVAPCGLESPDSPACIVRIDSNGDMRPTTPNQPMMVTAIQLAGGKFLIRWRYTPIDQEIAPSEFRIYVDSGSGFNFTSPAGTVNYKLGGRGEFKWESDAYTHGHRIKFCVRAYAQGKGETMNTDYVAAVADALGPDALTDVFATVEQLP
jgi:hypothetical protein